MVLRWRKRGDSIHRHRLSLLLLVVLAAAFGLADCRSSPSASSGPEIPDSAKQRVAQIMSAYSQFVQDLKNKAPTVQQLDAGLQSRLTDNDALALLTTQNGLVRWANGVQSAMPPPDALNALTSKFVDLPYVKQYVALRSMLVIGPGLRTLERTGTVSQGLEVSFQPACVPPAAPCSEQSLDSVLQAVGWDISKDVTAGKALGEYLGNIVSACVLNGHCTVADIAEQIAAAALAETYPAAFAFYTAITLVGLAAEAGAAWQELKSDCEDYQRSDTCKCQPPLTQCPAGCVDTTSAYFDCGRCGQACDGWQDCVNSHCVPVQCSTHCPDGCCDDQGVCQAGTEDDACGVGGSACQACTGSDSCGGGGAPQRCGSSDGGSDSGDASDGGCVPLCCSSSSSNAVVVTCIANCDDQTYEMDCNGSSVGAGSFSCTCSKDGAQTDTLSAPCGTVSVSLCIGSAAETIAFGYWNYAQNINPFPSGGCGFPGTPTASTACSDP